MTAALMSNQGVFENIKNYVRTQYLDRLNHVCGAGFFYRHPCATRIKLLIKRLNILLQIAGNIQDLSCAPSHHVISYRQFAIEMFEGITRMAITSNVIICPNMFGHLRDILNIMDMLPDKFSRELVVVTTCVQRHEGASYISSLYKQIDLNVLIRFHANACSFVAGNKTIHIINYIKIENLYRKLRINNFIDAREKGFEINPEAEILEISSKQKHFVVQKDEKKYRHNQESKRELLQSNHV